MPDDDETDGSHTENKPPAETGVFDSSSGNSRYKVSDGNAACKVVIRNLNVVCKVEESNGVSA